MKYLTLIALALAATTTQADFWDNCTAYGGTIITANSYGNDKGGLCNDPNDSTKTNNCNGQEFCRGGNKTKWWPAFTWCESIGGRLASFEHMCPGNQTINSDTCANVKGIDSGWGWTSTGWGADTALHVNLSSGAVNSISNRTDGNFYVPVCEK